MKYWRGYLVAGIIAACTFALQKFAEAHSVLVDMFYPYVTRMMQSFLADWGASVDFCIWQVLLIGAVVVVLTSAVLMLIFKWNPIQWFGWVLTGAAVVGLLNLGIYGLNRYAGPLAEDIRLNKADYTVEELKTAAAFYRDEANRLALEVGRDANGDPQFPEFAELARQAGAGFKVLTRQEFYSVFAGSTVPVKELGWSGYYTAQKVGGKTVGITGEAAVNPKAPAVYLPFGMCEQMSRRMCIANDPDAEFAAFLACRFNPDVNFQYSGYLAAYNYCESALEAVAKSSGDGSGLSIKDAVNPQLAHDLEVFREFFGSNYTGKDVTDLLVSWHIQNYVLPLQQEEEVLFDPLDETQVDLTGLPNAPEPTAPAEETQADE